MSIGWRKLAVAVVVWVTGCGGTDGADPTPTNPKPLAATLEVTVLTSGGDPDVNGYEVVIDTMRRQVAGGVTTAGVLRTQASLVGLPPGTYPVTLSGVASNCSVSESLPQQVALVGGQKYPISFTVTCQATGVEISSRTTGADNPPVYDIVVDGRTFSTILANGAAAVTRLAPGSHVIGLGVRTTNCQVPGGAQVTVNVTTRVVTPLKFDVTCTAAVRHAKIAYVVDSLVGGVQGTWVVVADADGSGAVPIAQGNDPAWSPDGRELAYSNAACGPFDEYYGYPCAGGIMRIDPERWISSTSADLNAGFTPVWSPAGDALLFTRCCVYPDRERLYFQTVSAAGTITVPMSFSGIAVVKDPAWSFDGQRLAFICTNPAQRNTDVCTAARTGGAVAQITNDATLKQSPSWSPDGRSIVFGRQTTSSILEVIAMSADGKTVTKVADGFGPAWLPDGTILFADGTGIFTIAADGTNRVRITRGTQRAPAWRP